MAKEREQEARGRRGEREGSEVEPQRGPVAAVMPLKVMPQQCPELLGAGDAGAGGHQVAAGQGLLMCRAGRLLQLIYHHLPHGVTSRRTVL